MNLELALATAPLALYPTALVCLLLRAVCLGDGSAALDAPFDAARVLAAGYPLAWALGGATLRLSPRLLYSRMSSAVDFAAISGNGAFWLVVEPFAGHPWSSPFCTMVAGAGAVTSLLLFRRLAPRSAGATPA